MAHSLARLCKFLVFPIAGALILGAAGTVYAQSSPATGTAAVAQGTGNGTAAGQKRQTDAAIATGRTAVSRYATSAAAPIALALENTGPAPSSTPEPITLALVGGALAGLYGMRRHLS
jgi:hypothetical protein